MTARELPSEWVVGGSPAEKYRKAHPDRGILSVNGACVASDEVLFEQCRIAMQQGFPEVSKPSLQPYEDALYIVGAGLSAIECIDEIPEGAPTMALKGAHDWMIKRGRVPTMACAVDPRETRARCFTPHHDVVYMLSSTMHPAAWEHMRGYRVMLWHQYITKGQLDLPEWKDKTLITGGCTTGTRSIPLAFFLGFREIHLLGMDSCVAWDGTYKVDGSRTDGKIIDVWVGEEKYTTSPAMYSQVQGLHTLFAAMPGVKIIPHGDGLMQAVIRAGKDQGWKI